MNKLKIIKIISIILALSLIYFIINRFLIHTPTQTNTVKYSRKPVIENFSDADDMKELIEFSQQQNEQNKDNDNQEKSVIFLDGKGYRGNQGEIGDEGDIGDRGIQGKKGPVGFKGFTPTHEWDDTNIRFEHCKDGEKKWSKYLNLKGDKGPKGDVIDTNVDAENKAIYLTPTDTKYGKKVDFAKIINTWGIRTGKLKGAKGYPGERGDRGNKGDKGDKGLRGQFGIRGEKGLKGLTGNVGRRGDQGPVGPIGQIGVRGDIGVQGEEGLQGPTGDNYIYNIDRPLGTKGDTGPIGLTGVPGIKGAQGNVGPIGPRGLIGDKGQQGNKGPIGQQGERGERGNDSLPSNLKGNVGNKGPIGNKGLTGNKGPKGDKGIKGEDSSDGKLINKYWVLSESEEVTLPSSFNVGIGKNSPNFDLDVDGNIYAENYNISTINNLNSKNMENLIINKSGTLIQNFTTKTNKKYSSKIENNNIKITYPEAFNNTPLVDLNFVDISESDLDKVVLILPNNLIKKITKTDLLIDKNKLDNLALSNTSKISISILQPNIFDISKLKSVPEEPKKKNFEVGGGWINSCAFTLSDDTPYTRTNSRRGLPSVWTINQDQLGYACNRNDFRSGTTCNIDGTESINGITVNYKDKNIAGRSGLKLRLFYPRRQKIGSKWFSSNGVPSHAKILSTGSNNWESIIENIGNYPRIEAKTGSIGGNNKFNIHEVLSKKQLEQKLNERFPLKNKVTGSKCDIEYKRYRTFGGQ